MIEPFCVDVEQPRATNESARDTNEPQLLIGDTVVAENFVENLHNSMAPYVVRQLFGASMQNNADLGYCDLAPQTDPLQKDSLDEPNTTNYFATLAQFEEGEIEAIEEDALIRSIEKSSERKRKHTKSPKMDRELVVDLGIAVHGLPIVHPITTKQKSDKDGFTPVISKKILRRAGNQEWITTFPEGFVHVHPRGLMDHSPLIHCVPMQLQRLTKSFQYFNYMSDLDDFMEAVVTAWNEPWFGDPMCLVTLNKRHGNLHSRVHLARVDLHNIQQSLCTSVTPEMFKLELGATKHLDMSYSRRGSLTYFSDTIANASHNQPCMLEDLDFATISDEHSLFVKGSVSNDLILKTLKGPIFCEAVEYFFRTSVMHSGLNSTGITLVPKVATPTNMKDFRPISLCNIAYKCIANILVARLKHELFRGYSRKTGVPKCALKVDLHKAFDSLDWNFLIKALHRLGFPSKFLGWIYACISTAMYLIKINSALARYFKGKKGLRQGDPMSPYLFTVAMNVLSSLLLKTPDAFKFHWKCKELKLTHLFYVDDVLLFSHGDEAFVKHNMQYLDLFSS
ncbi:uncharacterized protein LOC141673397 [Apium graveolens]|uniref:uncharacterized protein LOC141673397 n=1 Tax=Apium graveolens TaxID=4045 RepID=UPI003D7990BE